MACELTTGFTRDCSDSTGGIEEIYLINRDDFTYTLDGSNSSLIATISTSTWYRYYLKKEVGSIVATTSIDPANGTRFSEGLVAFSINKFDATKTNELKVMILAQLGCIVKDNNGKYWALGFQNFAEGQSLVANTGTAYGDRNGYDIEIMAKEQEPPFEVPESVILSLTLSP